MTELHAHGVVRKLKALKSFYFGFGKHPAVRSSLVAAFSVFAFALVVSAGSLTPPGSPASTMYTLAQIFNPLASGSYDSTGISADQNGSLFENIKYIESQLGWASASNNLYYLGSGNVGIGDSSPETKFEVVGAASVSQLYIGGSLISSFGVTSDSLDFDEFVDSMTLDANTTIASGGFKLGIDSQGYAPAAMFSLGRKPFSQGYISGSSLTPALMSVVKRFGSVPVTSALFQSIWDLPAGGGGIGGYLFANQTASSSAQNMTGTLIALTGVAEHVGTGAATAVRGVLGQGSNRNTGSLASARGVVGAIATFGGAGTTTNAYNISTETSITTGTVSNLYGFYTSRLSGTGGVISSWAGMGIEHLTQATNNTGLLIASTSSALNIPAGNFGIYNGSPYTNYFASNLGIGDSSPETTFEVAGTSSISGQAYFGSHVSVSGNFEAGRFGAVGPNGAINFSLYQDRLGFQTESTLAVNRIITSDTGSSLTIHGVSNDMRLNFAATGTDYYVGQSNYLETDASNAGDIGYVYGQINQIVQLSATDMTTAYGSYNVVNPQAGNITDAYGLVSAVHNSGAGAITNAYVLYADVPLGGGTTTNRYGLYIGAQNGSGVANGFNIYSAGATSRNVFEGHASVSGNFELGGFVASNLTPRTTNTFSLGTSSLRWNNVFAANASISNNLEVSNIASVSQLYVGGIAINPLNQRPASDSLDFDEFVDAMTLDANTTIASAGFNLNFSDTYIRANGGIGISSFDASAIARLYIAKDAANPTRPDIYIDSSPTGSSSILFDTPGTNCSIVIDSTGRENMRLLCGGGRLSVGEDGTGSGGGVGINKFDPDTALDVNGSATISGNFELTGFVASSLTPRTTDTFDLGTSALRWRDLYLASGSLHIGTSGDEAIIDYNVNDDYLAFKPNGSTTGFVMTDTGRFGIASASPIATLGVEGSMRLDGYLHIGTNGTGYAFTDVGDYALSLMYRGVSGYGGGASALYMLGDAGPGGDVGWGGSFIATSEATNSNNLSLIQGTSAGASHFGTGTVTNVIGDGVFVENGSSGTVTNMTGTQIQLYRSGAGTITNTSGLRVITPAGSGFTNLYGVYVEAQTQGTNSYNIYSAGATTRNFFAGHASIGGNFELTGFVASNLTPRTTDTFDLGTSALRWRDLYLASGSLHIGTSGDEAVIDYNVNDDYLSFKPDGSTTGFVMTDTGNLGIGDTTPGYMLELGIGGDINLASSGAALRINGDVILHNKGNESTGVGYLALSNNTSSALRNTAIGAGALRDLTTGDDNVAIGREAMYLNTGGANNVVIGNNVMSNATAGSGNVALGTLALFSGINISTNVALGGGAGFGTLGSDNIFVGTNAGYQETGSNTLWIDNQSTASDSAFLYGELDTDYLRIGADVAIYSGADTTLTLTSSDLQLNLINSDYPGGYGNGIYQNASGSLVFDNGLADFGGASAYRTVIDWRGNFSVGNDNLETVNYKFQVASGSDDDILRLVDSDGDCRLNPEVGSLTTTCPSDERLKTDVVDSESALTYLQGFRVRDYTVKANGERKTGVIAQELRDTHPELVVSLEDGVLAVQQPNPFILIKAIQEQQAMIEALQNAVNQPAIPLLAEDDSTLLDRIVALFSSILGIEFGQGSIAVDELCVGSVCVTEEQFIEVFGNGSGSPETPAPTPSEDPTPEVTPEPTPENGSTDEPLEEPTPEPSPEETPTPEPEPSVEPELQP